MTSCNQEATSEVLLVPQESPYFWGQCCGDWDSSSDSEDDAEAKSKNILQEMETISIKLKESEFYSELNKQINSVDFQSQLTRVRSGHDLDKVPMVIYGLGSVSKSNQSRHQLAFALSLQRDLSDWISDRIEVYDPKLSKADMTVLEELGCTVLSVNEEGKRRVERPTLFFMPHAPTYLEGNLLEANWSPSNINHVILLTNKMTEELEYYQLRQEGLGLQRPLKVDLEEGESFDDYVTLTERREYVEAIQKCEEELQLRFTRQFDKLPKLEQGEIVDLFEASIIEELRSEIAEAESAL
ncbi:hypothetical protein PTKIN_Ptkin03bG0050200 [Pterospermum kingtungense]